MDQKFEINVLSQINALSKVSFLAATEVNRGLINFFNGTEATNQQHHDLLNFRHTGDEEYKQVKGILLYSQRTPCQVPNRRKALQTFQLKKLNRTSMSA